MGLDMYLYQDVDIFGMYDFEQVEGEINITKKGVKLDIDLKEVEYIRLQKAYWRKANQIHNYIVQHFADGVDECQEINISGDDIIELRGLCERILNLKNNGQERKALNLAKKELPTTSGFFFGSVDYDEWYFEDLESTVEQLKDIDPDKWYIYRASW